ESLPRLERALSSGELSWSAARELTRVALCETEHEWLEFAHGKTLRQLEQALAGKQPGDAPGSPPDPSARRHVLRFEVAAETFALFGDALRELRRRSGEPLDDDSALLELARCALGGPRDEGRASYQVVLGVCPECGSARQHAAGGLVPVGPELIRMAHCDAQHLGSLAEPSPAPANDLQPHETSAEQPGCPDGASAIADEAAHVCASTTESQTADVNRAAAVTSGAAAEQDTSSCNSPTNVHLSPRNVRVRPRATQTIPPALRRSVLLRDQRRCQVPGCQNRTWLDLHHLELRSEGGRHSMDNLSCICAAHHRAAHRGEIVLDRDLDGALRVRHADGTAYGGNVKPQALEVRAKVFSALRKLGFRESRVRAALEQLLRETAFEHACFDGLLRAALAQL